MVLAFPCYHVLQMALPAITHFQILWSTIFQTSKYNLNLFHGRFSFSCFALAGKTVKVGFLLIKDTGTAMVVGKRSSAKQVLLKMIKQCLSQKLLMVKTLTGQESKAKDNLQNLGSMSRITINETTNFKVEASALLMMKHHLGEQGIVAR